MTAGPVWEAGEKTHRDENFPVASHLVSKQHRPPILAFYRFARAADDVADHPELSESGTATSSTSSRKPSQEDRGDRVRRFHCAPRSPNAGFPRKPRPGICSWLLRIEHQRHRSLPNSDDIIHSAPAPRCRSAAALLDVHGESRATWAADAARSAPHSIHRSPSVPETTTTVSTTFTSHSTALPTRNIPVEDGSGALKACAGFC